MDDNNAIALALLEEIRVMSRQIAEAVPGTDPEEILRMIRLIEEKAARVEKILEEANKTLPEV